ncbi:hypothetical protein [Deinococcus aerophilus]|uniref:hypothetical protein n=1 Tax=Deinococcus aerophilus TaxID=522488 RepID=UPI001667710D|nr:hypothetical protein [Deinococcus aerophilus]
MLLLLAYLCVEGPQPRRRLAQLFWPEAANPMNSLAQHLVHLRTLPGAVQESGTQVAPGNVSCDACELRDVVRGGRARRAAQLYGGPFLETLSIPLGADLEEWVFETREAVALEVRGALLELSRNAAAHGRTEEAGRLAAQALTLRGAPPADALELPRLWHLLRLAGHPLSAQVEREAHALGLSLGMAPDLDATPFVGREKELGQLSRLRAGTLAWVSGPGGMGKSALLLALARAGGWTVLPARAGHACGTPQLLVRGRRSTDPVAPLSTLRDPALRVAIDDWEGLDEATRAALALMVRQRPGATIVVASRRHPPFDVDLHLGLGPLPPEVLAERPGLHALTDGHPTLVGAVLGGQPLDARQGARVRALPPRTREAFLLLALQDVPDLRATCRALAMNAAEFAATLSTLVTEGLSRETGHIYAAAAARERVECIHVQAHLLHLKLARALPPAAAWAHYDLSRDLWEDADEDRAAHAAARRAAELLDRGYPGDATGVLTGFTDRPELAVLHAWALLGVGRHAEALRRLDTLSGKQRADPAAVVARATALVRLGHHEEASLLARGVGGSGPEAARAASVLAHAAHIRGAWDEARRHAQIAADLWQLSGNEQERLGELVLVASMQVRLGAAPETAFRGVLDRSLGLPSVRGSALLNYAQALMDVGQAEQADAVMGEAIVELTRAGDRLGLASAHLLAGVRRQMQGALPAAAALYRQALSELTGTGDIRQMGLALSNLSEIEGDLSAFEDALEMLRRAGQHELVAQIRRNATLTLPSPGRSLRS